MKKLSIAVFYITLLVLSNAVLAQNLVEMSLAEANLFIYTGESATLEATVKNNREKTDIFSVSVFPSFLNKIGAFPETAATSLTLKAGESATVKLFFSAMPEAEETAFPALFKITVISLTDEKISANQTLQINVLRTSPVYLSDSKTNKYPFEPGETLEIKNELINTGNSPSDTYKLEILMKKDKNLVKRFDETSSGIARKSSETVTSSYTFGRYAEPGVYMISINLKDNLNTLIGVKSLDIKVNEVNKTTTESSHQFRVLTVDRSIKIENVGNVPTSVVLKEFVPSFARDWMIAETDPTSVNVVGDSVVYQWLITLAPGQEATIKYQFNLWNVWIGLLTILLVIYFAFKFVFAPSITKIVKVHGTLHKGKEIVVTLEARNRSLGEIKDIVITDVVPQLTQVVQQFDTLKPAIKKTSEGTELTWKLDSLKTAEERVINYRIKPTVDVDSLELPSGKMGYYDGRRVKKFVVSRAVLVKGTQ